MVYTLPTLRLCLHCHCGADFLSHRRTCERSHMYNLPCKLQLHDILVRIESA